MPVSNSPQFVFIPGLLCDATLWRSVIDAWIPPESCKIMDIRDCRSISEFAQTVIEQNHGDVVLVGFSLGAWIALEACRLLEARCKSLILISSAPGHLKPETRALFADSIKQIEAGEFEEFIQLDFEIDVALGNQSKAGLKDAFFEMMRKQGPEVAIRQLSALVEFRGDFSDLSSVRCPVLLVRGVEDKSVNTKRQEQMQHEIANATLEVIPDSGHYVPIENPLGLAQVCRQWFLRTKNASSM